MQKLRPHFHKSVSELQQVFDASTRDRARLNELLRELRHRATPTAQALQRRVESALRRLPSELRRDDDRVATPGAATAGSASAGPSTSGTTTCGAASSGAAASGAAAAGSASAGPAHGTPAAGAATASATVMPATLQIRCRQCQRELRIVVRAPHAAYGCPRCKAGFEAAWRDGAFQIEWQAAATPAAAGEMVMDRVLARQILAVHPDADAQAIKQAWRRACQRYHPDKHMRLPERLQRAAEAEIQRINAAYELLSRAETSVGR